MVRHGADINRFGGVGEQRETPLHDAAKGGHLQVRKKMTCPTGLGMTCARST